MQVTIHRGTHQIGGCATEIKTAKSRIIIDIGTELPRADGTASLPLNIDGVTSGNACCDAVFITHYHGDHVGMFESVLPTIPIYIGTTSKQIYTVVQQTLKNKLGSGNPDLVGSFNTFEIGKPINIKDIKITPFVVDHSAFDAYMFLIEAEGKRILHTGDFRMHGAKGRKMPDVFAKYAQNIDLLITEGTMLSRTSERVMTEHELGRKATEIMRYNKYVFVLCSSTNIDTIAELYNAAIANKKLFVVCEQDFQLEILKIVTANSRSSFYNFAKQKIFVYGENLHQIMQNRGFCFLGRTNYVTQKAMQAFPENVLVYSIWQGYLDKTHVAYDEYKASFVEKAMAGGSRFQYLHTSGHASSESLKQVCELTNAKIILPIHCEQPEAFSKLDVKGKVVVLEDGDSLTI
ncbi:MAG: MBL fold metallo-hydrolase [Clostridiales bacterium]|nr:MBL fold metallo-hydrolase [Clostridiales bacterium]